MPLTIRQAAGLVAATVLGAAVVVAALLDRTAIALAGLGAASVLLFLGMLQIRRRITGLLTASGTLADQLRATTEQVTSLRQELATAAGTHDRAALARHQELLAALAADQQETATAIRLLGSSVI